MVAKSKAGKKTSKVKVGKLKAGKGKAKNLTAGEAKKVRGGFSFVKKIDKS